MGKTRFSWRYLAFLAVQLSIIFHKVSGKGIFQLRLLSFTNDLGLDIDGNCCDGSPSQTDRQCSTPCRTYFKVCLYNFVQVIRTDPFPKCTYGNSTTDVIGNNSFEIPESEGLIELPFEFAWRNDFSLIVDAWHNQTQGSVNRLLERLAEKRNRRVHPEWVNETYTTDTHSMSYSYRIICEENFYGETCTRKCVSHDDLTGHYTCQQDGSKLCIPGWTGSRCTDPVCTERCVNGRCVGPNTCQCTPGWEGEHCDQCIRSAGCQHGTCTLPNECKCDEGWGGVLCEIDTNHCTNHKPCHNGGTCRNEGPNGYQCYCAEGFTGVDCEEVAVSSCLNGGTPVPSSSTTPCICPPDTRGVRCETYVPRCEPGRCLNGGSCIETQEGYGCQCAEGYVGGNCETIDHCANRPCYNGGTCRNLISGYSCECPIGYAGATCFVDICENHKCFNGGSCRADFDGARCECPRGFEGGQCQTNVDDCVGSPCQNDGTCLDLVNNYLCTCAEGYFGETCQKELCASSVNPCENGGTCSMDRIGGFTCSCAPGFEGMFCEHASPGSLASLPAGTPDVEPTASEVPNLDTSIKDDSDNELLRIIKMVVFVVFGFIILLLLFCLTVVICRKQRSERTPRDVEGRQAPPNNRVLIDNFSNSEKVLPLLSISEKVCNKEIEQDNLKATHYKEYTSVRNSSNTLRKNSINSKDYKIREYSSKDFECLQSSGETRSPSSSHEDCSVVRYVPQTRHSLPRNFDSEENSNSDEFYYYDERNVALKRTDSLRTSSQSSSLESTPKHTAKCPILQISAAVEDSPGSTQVSPSPPSTRHATEV